jgi:hypothetical protein
MIDGCPEELAVALEKLGEVTLTRLPGQPATGRAKVQVASGLPPGIPDPGPVEDYPGNYGVYRRVRYLYDGDETTCDGPREIHICWYERTADIVCHGHVLKPARKLGQRYAVKEWVGLCPEWFIDKAASASASAVSKLFSRVAEPDTGGQVTAGLGPVDVVTMGSSTTGARATVEPRISAPAFAAITQALADTLGMTIDIEPEALASGWTDLSTLSREISSADRGHAEELRELFGHLASVSLLIDGGSTDEAWINQAGGYITERWGRTENPRRG